MQYTSRKRRFIRILGAISLSLVWLGVFLYIEMPAAFATLFGFGTPHSADPCLSPILGPHHTSPCIPEHTFVTTFIEEALWFLLPLSITFDIVLYKMVTTQPIFFQTHNRSLGNYLKIPALILLVSIVLVSGEVLGFDTAPFQLEPWFMAVLIVVILTCVVSIKMILFLAESSDAPLSSMSIPITQRSTAHTTPIQTYHP